jgi:hypothetical protein
MMGIMGTVSSAPKAAVTSDRLSVLRALARLLDPGVDPEIVRIAASMPREDVTRAIEGLKEMVDTLVALTPLKTAVAAAIEDLQRREAILVEREVILVKRETAINKFLEGL